MSNNKIHIDSLFSNGLKNLEIPTLSNDLDKIKQGIENNQLNVFSDFELPISDNDWQTVKERLDKENEKVLPLIPLNDIGNGFKDFEIGVTNSDWLNTKQKLAQAQGNKKSRIVWFWWLNPLIISVISATAINYFLDQKIDNNSLVNSNQKINENAYKHTQTINNEVLKADKKNFNNENKLEVPKINDGNSELDKLIEKNAIYNQLNNHTSTFHHFDKLSVQAQRRPSSVTPKNETILIAENTPFTSNKTSEIIEDKILKNDIFKNQKQTNIKSDKKTIDDKLIDNTTEKLKDEIKTIESKPLDTSKKETKIEPPKKILPKFYVGLNTQMAQTHRTLSNSNKPIYNTIRNNAEKPFTQLSIGFVTGILKGKNDFQLGAQYTQQNWTSSYLYNYRIYDSLPVRNPNGDIIGYFLTRGRDTTINESQTIKISKIDIPFTYQYQQRLNNKTNLLLGFGGVLGLNIKTEGKKMINPLNNYLYPYKALSKNENKLSFSPQLNIGLQRNLNKNMLLQTNIFGNYSATSRFKNQFGVKDYPYSYGLNVKLLFLIH